MNSIGGRLPGELCGRVLAQMVASSKFSGRPVYQEVTLDCLVLIAPRTRFVPVWGPSGPVSRRNIRLVASHTELLNFLNNGLNILVVFFDANKRDSNGTPVRDAIL